MSSLSNVSARTAKGCPTCWAQKRLDNNNKVEVGDVIKGWECVSLRVAKAGKGWKHLFICSRCGETYKHWEASEARRRKLIGCKNCTDADPKKAKVPAAATPWLENAELHYTALDYKNKRKLGKDEHGQVHL